MNRTLKVTFLDKWGRIIIILKGEKKKRKINSIIIFLRRKAD